MATPIKHAVGKQADFETLQKESKLEAGKLYFVTEDNPPAGELSFYTIYRAINANTAYPILPIIPRTPLNKGANGTPIEGGDSLTEAFGKVQQRITTLEDDAAKMFTIKGSIELNEDNKIILKRETNTTFTYDTLDAIDPKEKGDAYRVTIKGEYPTSNEFLKCEVGDWLIYTGTSWAVIQGNIDVEGLKEEIKEAINTILADYEFTNIKAINIDALDYESGDIGMIIPFQNIKAHNFKLLFSIDGEQSFRDLSDILNLILQRIDEKISTNDFYDFFFPNRKSMSLWGWVNSEAFYAFGRYQGAEDNDDNWMEGESVLVGDYFIVEVTGQYYAGYEDENQNTIEFSCQRGDILRCISEGSVTSTGYNKEPRFEKILKSDAPRYINNIKVHNILVSEEASSSSIGESDAPFKKLYAEEVYVGKEDEQVEVGAHIININAILQWEEFS